MDNDPFALTDLLATAKGNLSMAIESGENIIYASGDGLIPIQMVEPDCFKDPHFREVVDTYDWPKIDDDGHLEITADNEHPKEFLERLRLSDGQGGYGMLVASSFISMIAQPPIRHYYQNDSSVIGALGVNPCLHRAHALAPDLFLPLQQAMAALRDIQLQLPGGTEDVIYNFLCRAENKDVLTALYMSYRILSRLIKIDDYARSIALMNHSVGIPPIILSADSMLLKGH